ncbi:MAG: 30S ribosomal protein S8 [Candidatus Omnitrophica bacterium]|nr:30S ribosomal protein S8 [Candidatus Omnitrophota bacterium]
MSVSDPISNMLTSVRNAVNTRKETVDVPASKLLEKILGILKTDGYIADVRLLKDSKQGTLKIYLKYATNKKAAIMGLKRISKPGLRVYATGGKVPKVLNGLGTAVISTSKGVITDREARKLNVGGEVICYIW